MKPEEWRKIHREDCMAASGKSSCGYECIKCGLCTNHWHVKHKAPLCFCYKGPEVDICKGCFKHPVKEGLKVCDKCDWAMEMGSFKGAPHREARNDALGR